MENERKPDNERTEEPSVLEGDHNNSRLEQISEPIERQNENNGRFNLEPLLHDIDSNIIQNVLPEREEVVELVEGSAEGQSNEDNEDPNAENEEMVSFEEISINHWCDLCKQVIAFDDIESHLIECTTKPYNEDVLSADSGDCPICLEALKAKQLIARLPCLCLYHIECIKSWYRVVRACPQHPID